MLNPKKGEITKIIDNDHKEDDGFILSHLYYPCLECIQNEDFARIKKKTVNGPITMFLLNWGRMGRVLEQERFKGWEQRLTEAISRISNKLELFRKMKLEDVSLEEYKDDITECYDEISNIVRYTAAAKTLHLLAPDFFPLWDENIRNKTKEESGKKINHMSSGYFEFVKVMQEFLKNKNNYDELIALSKKYNRPKPKLMDEYFWLITR
jgi:hypothetical protein